MSVFEKHWTFWRNSKYANGSAVQWAASECRQLRKLSVCRTILSDQPSGCNLEPVREPSPPRCPAAEGGSWPRVPWSIALRARIYAS